MTQMKVVFDNAIFEKASKFFLCQCLFGQRDINFQIVILIYLKTRVMILLCRMSYICISFQNQNQNAFNHTNIAF